MGCCEDRLRSPLVVAARCRSGLQSAMGPAERGGNLQGSHGKTSMAPRSRALQACGRAGEGAMAFQHIPNGGRFAPLKSRALPGSRGSVLHGTAPSWAISVLKRPGFTIYCLRDRKGRRG